MQLDPSTNSRIAQLVKRLREVAEEKRRPYMDTRSELLKYAYDKTYDFLYQQHDPNLSFKAKCAKAAQFVEIMGAALYPSDPKSKVNSFEWATPQQRMRHPVEEQYCDYAARRGGLHSHMRKCLADALIGGRGVIWTGFNQRKGCIQHVFDTVDNFLIDPDARCADEANWVARRRVKPRWWLAAQYPDSADAIAKLERTTEKASDGMSPARGTEESASELIEYWEMYLRVGLHNYAPGLVGPNADPAQYGFGTNDPMKLCVAEGEVLSVEPWEIPFHLDDMWPCEWLDLREKPGSLWPAAPMETGLGHLRALNYGYTTFINHILVASRLTFMSATYNGQGIPDENVIKLIKGKDLDMIKVTINGDVLRLSDFLQQLEINPHTAEFSQFLQIVGTEFEKETGLYEVLYTGNTPTQIRNATTADMIRNSSQSRIEDMRTVMNKFMGKLFYKYAFGARYLHTPEEIGTMFGPQAAQVWGTLAPPEMVAQERQMRQQTGAMLSQAMGAQAVQMGMQPDPAQLEAQIQGQLGPEQLVDFDEWINEAARDIEGGSMRPMQPETQIANLNVALNQLAPAVATLPGGGSVVAALAVEFARVNRFSLDTIDAMRKFQAQCAAVTDMQVTMASAPPPPPTAAGTPAKPPKSGPEGGNNQETG
jgi:hypothetical protein